MLNLLSRLFKKNKEEKKNITLGEINEILVNKYKQKPLRSAAFNFDLSLVKSCVFEIEHIELVLS